MSPDPYTYLNRHVSVSHETVERLVTYHDLLLKWQSKINLISPTTIGDVWTRHFLDSVQLLPMIPKGEGAVLDIGTGAGFPGLALAICGVENIHLIESDAKKIEFLREVARVTKTHVTLHPNRVEKLEPIRTKSLIARAVADLEKLFELSFTHVSHETICLFPKGKNYSKELEDASLNWSFDHMITKSVADTGGVILQISNIRRRSI